MILAYYRLGQYEDARRSMRHLLSFADRFRMDNPLVKFGSDVYQPQQKVNLCYDTLGPAAALLRGLFEYLYSARELRLVPHIPPGITELEQVDPVRFGRKLLTLSVRGKGSVTGVRVNGRRWGRFDARSVRLPYSETPDRARVEILLGGARPARRSVPVSENPRKQPAAAQLPAQLERRAERLRALEGKLTAAGLGNSYEAAHVRLILEALSAVRTRRGLQAQGKLPPLPEADRQAAADQSFTDAAQRLYQALEAVLSTYATSSDTNQRRVYRLWRSLEEGSP